MPSPQTQLDEHVPLLIIGAGPAGLGACWRWQELATDACRILEASTQPGGLSASFRDDNGFTWDLGSHLLFSHFPYFDDVMETVLPASEWQRLHRSTYVWFDGRFIPYPFQLHLHHLSPTHRWECVQGLLDRPTSLLPGEDFGTWCERTFGQPITRLFMRPYNEKLWGCALESMSASWVAERVAVPDIRDVLRGLCMGEDQSNWGPNAVFRYPRTGGAGAVWTSLAERLRPNTIHWQSRVVRIDADSKFATTADGRTTGYKHLISTVPMTELWHMLGCPEELNSIPQLRHNSTSIVGVGLTGQAPPSLAGQTWSYFPQAEIPFYRLTVLSNLSPHMVPNQDATWSLLAEVSEVPGQKPQPDTLRLSVVTALEHLSLIRRTDIVSLWSRRVPYGYPVPTLNRDRILQEADDWLSENGIFSRGRFGAWRYEVSNQDHSFMQGVDVVTELLSKHSVAASDTDHKNMPVTIPSWFRHQPELQK